MRVPPRRNVLDLDSIGAREAVAIVSWRAYTWCDAWLAIASGPVHLGEAVQVVDGADLRDDSPLISEFLAGGRSWLAERRRNYSHRDLPLLLDITASCLC